MDELTQRVTELERKVDDLTAINKEMMGLLREISTKMDGVERSASKMDDHIDFVDGVYDSIKSPFHRAMNMIAWRTGESGASEPPQRTLKDRADE